MHPSHFAQPLPPDLWDQAAEGSNEEGKPFPFKWRVHPELATAGLWSTAGDMAICLTALMKAMRGLKPEFLSKAIALEVLKRRPNTKYGLGFVVGGEGHATHIMKLGQNSGFQGWLVAYPFTGQGLVVIANSDNGRALAETLIYGIAKKRKWPKGLKLLDAWMLDKDPSS